MSDSKLVLHSIHLAKNGDILMRGSASLVQAFRKVESELRALEPTATKFDICETRSGQFRAMGDTRDIQAADRLARQFLHMYRMALGFEKAFATQAEYNNWFLFNRRQPTATDLKRQLMQKGFFFAELGLPYIADVQELFPVLELKPKIKTTEERLADRKVVRGPDGKLRVVHGASPNKIDALISRFQRS